MAKGKKNKNITVVATEKLPPCHIGFKEVYKNVFVGKASEIGDVLDRVDVIVPLNSVSGKIWDLGWKGEIMYVPITDFSTLPKTIEKQKVRSVLNKIKAGRKVAIFCEGGHGRTGYFASLILGKLGVEDPINQIRTLYCEKAVETSDQVEAIADFLDKQELIKRYPCYTGFEFGNYGAYNYDWLAQYYSMSKPTNVGDTCGKCKSYHEFDGTDWGWCDYENKTVNYFDKKCK